MIRRAEARQISAGEIVAKVVAAEEGGGVPPKEEVSEGVEGGVRSESVSSSVRKGLNVKMQMPSNCILSRRRHWAARWATEVSSCDWPREQSSSSLNFRWSKSRAAGPRPGPGPGPG